MFLSVIWMITAMVVGFSLGRASMYGPADPEEGSVEREEPVSPANGRFGGRRTKGRRTEGGGKTWSVGSPMSGEVSVQNGGEHPVLVIHSADDRLYAPVNGKVIRLFPMGNAMLFATEFGMELYIQVGDTKDDLLGRYYRPRIVQNEIVVKGKLLLEFDRQGLAAEGAFPEVTVCVENCSYGSDIRLIDGASVKAGEEIMQVREPEVQGILPDGYAHG